MSPITETDRTCLSCTTNHAESVDDETNDCNNFNQCNPIFDFSVVSNWEEIYCGQENIKYKHPSPVRNCVCPILNDLSNGKQLNSKGDWPLEPIKPVCSHTNRLGYIFCIENTERSCNWSVCCQLTKGLRN